MLRIRDTVLFNPWIRILYEKNLDQDQGLTSQIIYRALTVFLLKFFNADSDLGSFRPWIRDGKIRIRDPVYPDPQH